MATFADIGFTVYNQVPSSAMSATEFAQLVQSGGSLYADLHANVGLPGMGIIVVGATSQTDGGQGFFTWNPISTTADDGNNTFKPTITAPTQPGRWIRTPLNMGFPPLQFECLGGVPPFSLEEMAGIIFSVQVTFPANFAGARGAVTTNPTATFVANFKKNGVQAGTMTVTTGGVFTFATTVTTSSLTFAPGDIMTVIAPLTADLTATNFKWVLTGTNG